MNIIQALIDLLEHTKKMSADDAVLRDIVRDNRAEMHKLVGPEEKIHKVTVVGAATLDSPSSEPRPSWNENRWG